MLIEAKVKTTRVVDNKSRKRTETYLLDKQFFSEAEYKITEELTEEVDSDLMVSFEIQSLRMSPIKEVCTQYTGEKTFIACLKDVFLEEDGTEKTMKYKVLLWANNLSEANTYVHELASQGYNMEIEGIKEVDYYYLTNEDGAEQGEG